MPSTSSMMMQTRSLTGLEEGERAAALPLPPSGCRRRAAAAFARRRDEVPKNPPALLPPHPPERPVGRELPQRVGQLAGDPAADVRVRLSAGIGGVDLDGEEAALPRDGERGRGLADARGPESRTAFLERSLLAPGPDFGVGTGAPWRWTDSLKEMKRRGGSWS